MSRTPNEVLAARFALAKATPSDINEHLDVLRAFAERCEHVTEMGMRGAVSTTALLAAQPQRLISWDINPYAIVSQTVADLIACAGRTEFQPRVGNTLDIDIEPTEMLFVDTLHTGKQLLAELLRHSNKVSKFIAFHDTITFGETGEDGGAGLRAAIRTWQKEEVFPTWGLVEDRENNNGLVVMARADVDIEWYVP